LARSPPSTHQAMSTQRVSPDGIDPERLREHLNVIDFSDTFARVEEQRRLLHFLVERRIAGRPDHVKASEMVAHGLFTDEQTASLAAYLSTAIPSKPSLPTATLSSTRNPPNPGI